MVFKLNVTFHPQGNGFSHPTCLPARSILSSFQDSSSRHSLDRKSSQGGRARRTNPSIRPLSRPRPFGGGELVAQLRSISLSMGKSSRLRKGTRLAGAQRQSDRRSLGRPDSPHCQIDGILTLARRWRSLSLFWEKHSFE